MCRLTEHKDTKAQSFYGEQINSHMEGHKAAVTQSLNPFCCEWLVYAAPLFLRVFVFSLYPKIELFINGYNFLKCFFVSRI